MGLGRETGHGPLIVTPDGICFAKVELGKGMRSYLNSENCSPATAGRLSTAFNIQLRSALVCRDSFLVSDPRLLCIVSSYDRDRQRLSQPDAQSLLKVTLLDVGWLDADIRHKKQTSQWQAVQAGLQPGLDRPVG
jgi:hypothetical protein